MKSRRNIWKYLFIGLLALNVALLVWMYVLIDAPAEDGYPDQTAEETHESEFTIVSTKENLNQLMNNYLDDLSEDQKIDYEVTLEEDVELKGSIMAFGNKVDLTMNFDPIVQDNGDLLLQQKSIKLGRLALPNRKVLDYLKDHYNLPEWVVINPKEETVYVALTEMKTKSDFSVKVKMFNLEKNQLAFKITVPDKTFDRFASETYQELQALR